MINSKDWEKNVEVALVSVLKSYSVHHIIDCIARSSAVDVTPGARNMAFKFSR